MNQDDFSHSVLSQIDVALAHGEDESVRRIVRSLIEEIERLKQSLKALRDTQETTSDPQMEDLVMQRLRALGYLK